MLFKSPCSFLESRFKIIFLASKDYQYPDTYLLIGIRVNLRKTKFS